MKTEGKTGAREMSGKPIAAIRLEFNYLVELLTFGEITKEKFLEASRAFLYFDGEGTAWAISLANGNWYKFVGGELVLGEPPEVLYRPIEKPSEEEKPPGRFCTSCGEPMRPGKKFCANCGRPA